MITSNTLTLAVQVLGEEKLYENLPLSFVFLLITLGDSVYSWGSDLFLMDLLSSAMTKGNR